MRIVVDPGGFVSALISPKGATGQLFDLLFERRISLVVSTQLLRELDEVLRRPKFRRYVSSEDVDDLISQLSATADSAEDISPPPRVCRDPDDDYLFALAVTGCADALVSGGRDLLESSAAGVPVLSPRELLDRLSTE